MARERTAAERRVAELLRTARSSLGLSMAFLSRLEETTQTLEVVESALPWVFKDGKEMPRSTSLCQAILDRKLPAVIPDLTVHPAAMELPVARIPRVRSYLSVPVRLSDGTLYGTFCALGFGADRHLQERDRALMEVLAQAAAMIIEPEVVERARRERIERRLRPVVDAGGPTVVLQPIVRLTDGRRVGVEALSRFPAEWNMPPNDVFAEAHSIDMGHELELLALERAADHLAAVPGYVAMNISVMTLLRPEAPVQLARLPLDRVVLELSEHDPVEDYDRLRGVLAPLRRDGMRLAVDDVGAGFSSLRHIVLTGPDVIKLDRSVIAGVAYADVLRTLVRALAEFGHGCGSLVVAEGVETAADAALLRELGVDLGQGWYFGRPVPVDELLETDAAARVPAPRSPADPATTSAPS